LQSLLSKSSESIKDEDQPHINCNNHQSNNSSVMNNIFAISPGMQSCFLQDDLNSYLHSPFNQLSLSSSSNNIIGDNVNSSTTTTNSPLRVCGQCLDVSDRDRIKKFVDEFVRGALVPYVEKLLVEQHEILLSRRGIGKSLNNMKKWLGTALSPTSVTLDSSPTSTNYGPESTERQLRRLADLAFQFGLYSFALQLYQALKVDFTNDQSWIHAAGALEMVAISSFLSSLSNMDQLNSKTSVTNLMSLRKLYPARYMEDAINYYANVCGQPMLAIKCVMFSAEIFEKLDLYTEAAYQLIRVSNEAKLSDLYKAVLFEKSATLFSRAGKFRRMAFYSVLAANHFSKLPLKDDRRWSHILRCCCRAQPYLKGWHYAENFMHSIVKKPPDNLNIDPGTL